MMRLLRSRRGSLLLGFCLLLVTGCDGSRASAEGSWTGSVDTLSSGQVRVHNSSGAMWSEGEEWLVAEELRLGSPNAVGPDLFGQIVSLEIDQDGRFWILEGQAQELRVFSAMGEHIRTVGRNGSGPGEFRQAVKVELGRDGHMWVMDPGNRRLSVFDTAGTYLEGKPAEGGFVMIPWPGRFDQMGNYYMPVLEPDPERLRISMVRYDSIHAATDTLAMPSDPVEREFYEVRSPMGTMSAGIPFQGSMISRISNRGTTWSLVTDEYRLFEIGTNGDTLMSITGEYSAIPVTGADREQAAEDLEWFTRQGGQIDLSKIPRTKPAAENFFVDDEGHIWVNRVSSSDTEGRIFDIFGPDGRFRGTVATPFPLSQTVFPIVRGGYIFGVTQDELGVQYVVRAQVVKPT